MEEQLFPDKSTKDESLVLYKLIVLYMLDTIETPLSNSQISDFMLTYNLATYFTIQQSINEMLENKLLKEEKVLHSTLFTLTDEGKNTLAYYKNIIPDDVIMAVNTFANENKLEIKQQLSIIANYEPTSDKKSFNVDCSIKEKNKYIFRLTIQAPDTEMAEKICDNWKKNHDKLYTHIMMELLKSSNDNK